MDSSPAFSIRKLCVTYQKRGTRLEAVRSFDMDLYPGKVHALIGESGSGKSTVAFASAGLLSGDQVEISGRIHLGSLEIDPSRRDSFQNIRGRKIGFVFQEPSTSLHPAIRIGTQIEEAIHMPMDRIQKRGLVKKLLHKVRLPSDSKLLRSYPHELSGGMQQRVLLAIAQANDPPLLFADEPTTALDPTTRKAILDQIKRSAIDNKRAILLITHDFGLVAHYADDVCVLLQGTVVEKGSTSQVLAQPQHDYTKSLIDAVPKWTTQRKVPEVRT